MARAAAWIVFGIFTGTAFSNVKLPAIFGDHMVWQGGVKGSLCGFADVGESVVVKVAGQEKNAVADAAGKWRVELEPIKSREPLEISVVGRNSITLHDVLVGEVWLCSGQSNMAFKLKTAANAREAIPVANNPSLRLFWVDRAYNDLPLSDLKGEWKVCTPEVAAEFSAVGYFFGSKLAKKLDVPVGLIEADWGGTRAEAWLPRATFDAMKLPYEPAWTNEWLHPKKKNTASTEPVRERPYEAPCTIFNGMISPMVGFPIRGVAWYQGETNTAYPKDYERVLTALITSWRDAWGAEDRSAGASSSAKPQAGGVPFPFLVVQLPNFLGPSRDWVTLRQSQANVAKNVPNVGMAVTIDIGDPHNIHPKNKEPVGHRLAALAEKMAYGMDVVCRGPTFKSVSVSGDEASVQFDHADGGLSGKDGEVSGFEIAGVDGKFVPAEARIDGQSVVLKAAGVKEPKTVRYGWKNEIHCTLYNGAGFPAEPFSVNQ